MTNQAIHAFVQVSASNPTLSGSYLRYMLAQTRTPILASGMTLPLLLPLLPSLGYWPVTSTTLLYTIKVLEAPSQTVDV